MSLLRLPLLVVALMGLAGNAFADCTGPAGRAGDMGYADNFGTMVFCNGSDWVSMAGGVSVTVGGTTGATTMDELTDATITTPASGQYLTYSGGGQWVNTASPLGTITDTKWCVGNSSGQVVCNTDAPITVESDPQVGTLTNTKWCTTDGTAINCATDAPVTTEVDPQLDTLTANLFCQVNAGGTALVCANTAATQRTALGLGTMALQNANAVAISGGSISGLTSLSVAGIVTATYFEGDGSRLTGIAPAATAASSTGAIQFNVANAFAGDGANLFWDDANNRLGIGTATPIAALDVNGNIFAPGGFVSATYYFNALAGGLTNSDVIRVNNVSLVKRGTSDIQYGNNSYWQTHSFYTNGSERFRINNSGNIGISTTNPNATLDVNGLISATGISVTGIVTATYFEGDGSRLINLPAGADNMGNHTATRDVLMGAYNISGTGYVSATAFYSGDGAAYFYNNFIIPSLVFDTDDYLRYTRATNMLDVMIGGTSYARVTSGGISTTTLYADVVSASTINIRYTSATQGYIGALTGSTAAVGGLTVTGASSQANVSVTNLIQLSNSAQSCSTGVSGTLRYSPTSSTVEYCNSTAWVSMGPSDTTPVSFYVHKNGTDQTGLSGWTKLTFSTEDYDTNNNFASNRFTATVPGKYLLRASSYCSGGGTQCEIGIYKNGVRVAGGFSYQAYGAPQV
ncbi:MAG: hypothetical protein WAX89_07850, partial [Alphaproteobacteria bacterium]